VTADTALLVVFAVLVTAALGTVLALTVTLPDRVARRVVERHEAEQEGARSAAHELAAVTAAQRALLVEQQKLAATLHGLARWLVTVALRGEAHPPPRVAGGGRQPDQPPRVRAGGTDCRPPPVTRVGRARVVVRGPWAQREHAESPKPAPRDDTSPEG
jgi:hypothetical protein